MLHHSPSGNDGLWMRPRGALSFSQGQCRAPGAPLGCPILLLRPFPDAALCALSLSRCWGQSPSTLTCPQGSPQLFPWPRRCSLGCLGAPPQRGVPPGRAIVPAEVSGGQGQCLPWPRGGQRLSCFWGAAPPARSRLCCCRWVRRDGLRGDTGGTHTQTPRGTHTPRVAPSFPPSPLPHPPSPSRWNPQCQGSASPPTRFSGAPFPRRVPLPATTRGTRCGCDPRDVTRVQFPWMSPAFPRDPSTPLPLAIVSSGATTRGASSS